MYLTFIEVFKELFQTGFEAYALPRMQHEKKKFDIGSSSAASP